MTYAAFLAVFVALPLVVLLALLNQCIRAGICLPPRLTAFPPMAVLVAHVVVAVLYTTPWDNYLVATGVWWYNPALVTGLHIGWVPIEEYAFFILQTLMTGALVVLLLHRSDFDAPDTEPPSRAHLAYTLPGLALWLAAAAILHWNWQPGTYLALILVWALPPILFQVWFGLDILRRERRAVLIAITATTLYLSLVDTLAIRSGTWTIDPAQSTGILIGGLPIEELIFFLVTNTLVTLGVTLVLSRASQSRIPQAILRLLTRTTPTTKPRRLSNA
jgi:lycopene cyclase domain-containing protein